MRMQEIASAVIRDRLLAMPAVTSVVGDRMINRAYLPQDMPLPALLHYAEPGGAGYGGSLEQQGLPDSLSLRYVIRLVCEGESTDPVAAAADTILRELAGVLGERDGYLVSATAIEPWPQSLGIGSLDELGVSYAETGDFYRVDILRTGDAS